MFYSYFKQFLKVLSTNNLCFSFLALDESGAPLVSNVPIQWWIEADTGEVSALTGFVF